MAGIRQGWRIRWPGGRLMAGDRLRGQNKGFGNPGFLQRLGKTAVGQPAQEMALRGSVPRALAGRHGRREFPVIVVAAQFAAPARHAQLHLVHGGLFAGDTGAHLVYVVLQGNGSMLFHLLFLSACLNS